VTDAAPGQVGDVQQAIDAAEVHERAVVGDVLDDTLDDGAFLEVFEQLLALFAHRLFQHGATRHHDVVALAVELDDLEFEFLAFVRRGVLDRTHVDQRTRQEGADAVGHDGQATLDLAGDHALDQGAVVERLLEVVPGGDALGLVARQAGFAVAVFEASMATGRSRRCWLRVRRGRCGTPRWDVAFGLQAGVDDDEVLVDAHDFGGDDFTGAHFLERRGFPRTGRQSFLRRRGWRWT
jgi:hypothetical protein